MAGIEDFFMATLIPFYCLGIALSVLTPFLFWFFWKKLNPAVLRTLFWAFRRRQPLLILSHDSGRSILTTITERQGEGIVKTAEGKYKILPRFIPKLPFNELVKREAEKMLAANAARQNGSEESENEESEDAQKEQASSAVASVPFDQVINLQTLKENFILDYGEYTNKRSMLVGLDLPVFVGYTGKLCLLNPEALALYETGEMLIRSDDGDIFNPHGVEGKSVKEAFQPLLLLNPRKIQEIIWKGFDQSQIAGVVADSEELERTRLSGSGFSPKMKGILMLLVLAAVGVAAVLFLPDILGGAKQVGVACAGLFW